MDEGDLLAEIRGESVMDTPVDPPPPPTLDRATVFAGLQAVLLAPFQAVAAPFTSAATLGTAGAGVLTNVGTSGAEFWSGAVEDVTEAANPLNLLGFGAGISFGGVMAVTTLALFGAFAADQAFFAGVGTRSLVARVVPR
jgi:hypothetical protein